MINPRNPNASLPIQVVLADDHDLVRSGIKALLSTVEGVQVIAEARNGNELLQLLESVKPDVVMTDISMPGMDGITAIAEIHARFPHVKVIVLSMYDTVDFVKRAVANGACGYLMKDASIEELMAGIRAASIGESLISSHIAGKVLQRIRATSTQPQIEEQIRTELSDREIEVLKLIANGKDNAMIAAELHISPKTVKNHISNILMKLQIENRIQAAVYAVRSGIV